jgi:glycolate oxidase FAD binding subunit
MNVVDKDSDISDQLQYEVLQTIKSGETLTIKAGGSKNFYGRNLLNIGNELNISNHQGIISYEPTELFIKARAGTPVQAIEQVLKENQQMLAFEPPAFGENATLGGTIACNFSGPRRAYSGAVRDYVLGTKIINGNAEVLSFGGDVMKNVAGYDVSRLMVGAMGTLSVILEASVKVVPLPETEITLVQNISLEAALTKLHQWSVLPLPISASCFYRENLYIRLSGAENAIDATQKKLGGEILNEAEAFWLSIKEHSHDFFKNKQSLWRFSLASNTPVLALGGDTLYEWGGALRWLKSSLSEEEIRAKPTSLNGHSSLFRSKGARDKVFQTLPKHLLILHQNLKLAFDPHNLFNIGRMYQEF